MSPPDYRRRGTTTDQIDRDVARRHAGAEPTTFPPPIPERTTLLDTRAILPWHRRFALWITDFHKFVTAVLGIAALTIVVHVWLKGLITRAELEVAVTASVEKAVTKVILKTQSDVSDIKDAIAGSPALPVWRGETTTKVEHLEERLATTKALGEKNERRIDSYIARRGGLPHD